MDRWKEYVVGPDFAAQRLMDLDELSRLHPAIDAVMDLNGLKPIFYRLELITRKYPDDDAVLDAGAAVKARLVAHGQRLVDAGYGTQSQAVIPALAPAPPAPPPVAPPPPPRAVQQPPPKPPAAAAGFNWKRAAAVGATMGVVIFSGIIYTVRQKHEKEKDPRNSTTSILDVKTTPPGASIRIGTDEKCKSNCKLDLTPGAYQIQAILAGHESAISTITIEKGAPAAIEFTLVPVAPSIRFFTDLQSGKVFVDNAPAGDLIDGQFVIEKAPAGKHVLKIVSQNGEASFEFDAVLGKLPEITGPVTARNMVGFVVANSGPSAKIWSSVQNLKASLDKTPDADVDAKGLEFQNLAAGDHELILRAGPEQRKILVPTGPQPVLMVFLKLDINAGTIIVITGEDGVSVSANGRPHPGKTVRGQLRMGSVPAGEWTINVAKDGYEVENPQKVVVKKGDETKVAFKLRPLPKLAALHLRGAIPGTNVVIDGQSAGTVSADGALSISNVSPGEHAIELRRTGFVTKRATRQFRAGEAIDFTGGDVLLEKAGGSIRLAVTPADARVTIKRSDEAQPRNIAPGTLNLAEGTYNLTARAPNYLEKIISVQIVSGESKNIEIALARQQQAVPNTPPPPPTLKAGTMANWDAPSEWWVEEGISLHRVGSPTYSMTPTTGVWSFDFVLKKGKALKWFFDSQDSKTFIFYQLDPRKDFSRRDGKGPEVKKAHGIPLPPDEPYRYQVQVEVTKTSIVTRVNGQTLDVYSPGRDPSQGKFGIQVPRIDIFGVANFRFQPRP